MRTPIEKLLLVALLALCGPAILVRPAPADGVVVDPATHTVNTSRLAVQFNATFPEQMLQVVFKDFDPSQPLTAYSADMSEFWGETYRSASDAGFLRIIPLSTSWAVTYESPDTVEISTSMMNIGQPQVLTRYHFYAGQPFFAVDRTILFSSQPDTSAYQAYVPQVALLFPYRALRWPDSTGAVVQRGYCLSPCVETNWNGHWVEHMTTYGTRSLGVASVYISSPARSTTLVRGYSQDSNTGWASLLVPAGAHTEDAMSRQLVAFTTNPANYTWLDSLWTANAAGSSIADVPRAPAAFGTHLAVSPNPAPGAAALAWTTAAAGAYTLDVLDVQGRRVSRLQAGWSAAGAHTGAWNGRDDSGRERPAGLYFVRLATASGATVARLVLTR